MFSVICVDWNYCYFDTDEIYKRKLVYLIYRLLFPKYLLNIMYLPDYWQLILLIDSSVTSLIAILVNSDD